MRYHFQHVVDLNRHRIVCGKIQGDWVSYQDPATIVIGTDTFIAFTEYWQGVFVPNQVFKLGPLRET